MHCCRPPLLAGGRKALSFTFRSHLSNSSGPARYSPVVGDGDADTNSLHRHETESDDLENVSRFKGPKELSQPVQTTRVVSKEEISVRQHRKNSDSTVRSSRSVPLKFSTENDRANSSPSDPCAAARNYAIRLLAMGPQPEANLRKKLTGRNYSCEVADKVIADLQRCGLQSDLQYAEGFAYSRWNGLSWGPNRIKIELARRGLSKDDIEAGLRQVFSEHEDEAGNGKERWDMSKQAKEQLIAQAQRQWDRGGDIALDVRKRRMVGWLERRGFSWSVIGELLAILRKKKSCDMD